MDEREDIATLEYSVACYPLRLFHPAGATVLSGSSPHGLSDAACARLFPTFDADNTTTNNASSSAATLHAWCAQYSPFRYVNEARYRTTLAPPDDDGGGGNNSSSGDTGASSPRTRCAIRARVAHSRGEDAAAVYWSWADRSCHHARPVRKVARAKARTGAETRTGGTQPESASPHSPLSSSSPLSLHDDPNGVTRQRKKRVREEKPAACGPPSSATTGFSDALASRVDDNDDLLRTLLNVDGGDDKAVNGEARAKATNTAAVVVVGGTPARVYHTDPPARSPHASSPPRTVFRYCSSNSRTTSPSRPCTPTLAPTTLTARPATTTTTTTTTVDTNVRVPPPRPQRARVPAFHTFVATAQETEAHTATRQGLTAAASKRLAKSAETEVQEAMKTVAWTVLVDHRERVKGSNAQMLAALARQGVPCHPCVLPCGDFVVGVTPRSVVESGRPHSPNLGDGDDTGGGDDTVGTGEVPVHATSEMPSHLFSLVVERKTADDLDASIQGSRYLDQRRLLAHAPFTHVVWLIEGEPRAHARFPGRGGHGASRSPSPPPSSSSVLETDDKRTVKEKLGLGEVEQRLDAACASLTRFGPQTSRAPVEATRLSPGFTVVRTRDVHESIAFLKQLALSYVREAAVHGGRRPGGPGCWLETAPLFRKVRDMQQHLRAQTAFPRVLMCIRGCASGLALWVTTKYGTLLGLWRLLKTRGRSAVDEDGEVQRLPITQKKVLVLLTEFLLATEYF